MAIDPDFLKFLLVVGFLVVWMGIGAMMCLLVDWIAPDSMWEGDARLAANIFWPLAGIPLVCAAMSQRMTARRDERHMSEAKDRERREVQARVDLLELKRAEQELESFLTRTSSND